MHSIFGWFHLSLQPLKELKLEFISANFYSSLLKSNENFLLLMIWIKYTATVGGWGFGSTKFYFMSKLLHFTLECRQLYGFVC